MDRVECAKYLWMTHDAHDAEHGHRIDQTSAEEYGQIYVPFVNWIMMFFTVAVPEDSGGRHRQRPHLHFLLRTLQVDLRAKSGTLRRPPVGAETSREIGRSQEQLNSEAVPTARDQARLAS